MPGLSLVLVDRRQPTPTFHHYGVAHLDLGALARTQPVALDTVFPIGASLAKNFVAVAVAQLHAQGKLRLDEPITTYLPHLRIEQSAKGAAPPITLRHLLSHTSGMREYRHRKDILNLVKEVAVPKALRGGNNASAAVAAPVSLADYYCGPAALPIQVVGTPGKQHIKSHHNYGLLALACEAVVKGEDIHSLLHKQLFLPLGMTHTDLVLSEKNKKHLTSSFAWSKKEGFSPLPAGTSGFDASKGRPRAVGGTAYSNVQDMARYVRALIDPAGSSNGALSESMLDELLRPVYQKDAFLPAQALSFAVEESFPPLADPEVGYVTCGQGMSFAGYQTAVVFSRQRGVGVGVLCNAGSDSYELSQVAAEAFAEVSRRAVDASSTVGSTALPPRKEDEGVATEAQQQLKCLEQAQQLKKAFGMGAPGFEAAVLWPQVVGVYQLPLAMLSARVLWTLGGEVQIYVEDSRLRMRALWGPLRTRLFTKEKGLVLSPARDGHPLHYSVSGAARQVLSTPVSGSTDIAFDLETGEMSIGLVTLRKSPWYQSMRLWAMGLLAYQSLKLIGRGKFIEIMTSLFVLG